MTPATISAGDAWLARQRLLVIAPHPDDECFGCAGTMARIKQLGGEVYVVVASLGDLKHYSHTDVFVSGQRRRGELEQVMTYLKVDDYDVLYSDAETHERLDRLPRRELVELFESRGRLAFDKLRPTAVAIPAISYNQDHEAVFRAAHTALRPGDPDLKHLAPTVLVYDNTALFWSLEREKFHPNFYVDISQQLETKIEALRLHQSQRKRSVHHASLENTRHIAQVRGCEVGTHAAEGYQCLRFLL